jgi:hypothetical protein
VTYELEAHEVNGHEVDAAGLLSHDQDKQDLPAKACGSVWAEVWRAAVEGQEKIYRGKNSSFVYEGKAQFVNSLLLLLL